MKDRMKEAIVNTYGDNIKSRFWLFLCDKDDEFKVLNYSDSYDDVLKMFDSCKTAYEDFFDLIYDYENDKLLDYGENPDAEEVEIIELDTQIVDDNIISHPSHYCFGKYEPRKVIRDWDLNFNLGNCIKYVARAGKKDGNSILQDLKKAKQYLEFEIEELEND